MRCHPRSATSVLLFERRLFVIALHVYGLWLVKPRPHWRLATDWRL